MEVDGDLEVRIIEKGDDGSFDNAESKGDAVKTEQEKEMSDKDDDVEDNTQNELSEDGLGRDEEVKEVNDVDDVETNNDDDDAVENISDEKGDEKVEESEKIAGRVEEEDERKEQQIEEESEEKKEQIEEESEEKEEKIAEEIEEKEEQVEENEKIEEQKEEKYDENIEEPVSQTMKESESESRQEYEKEREPEVERMEEPKGEVEREPERETRQEVGSHSDSGNQGAGGKNMETNNNGSTGIMSSLAKFGEPAKKAKGMFKVVQTEKCAACQKTVYAMEKLEMNGHIYHRNCFKCSHCSARLTPKTFSMNEGVIFCTTHFKQLFARKGNYDEGFGRQQYKKKWGEKAEGTSA